MNHTIKKSFLGAIVFLTTILFGGLSYSAWTNLNIVNSGETLTETLLNEIIGKINNIGTKTDGIFTDESGKVGIGTETPYSKFHITTTSGGWFMSLENLQAPEGKRKWGIVDGWSEGRFIIASRDDNWLNVNHLLSLEHGSGNMGIGVSKATYRLQLPNIADISGQAQANSWITYSDGRFKTDKETITNALKKVEELDGITYRSIEGNSPENNPREVGFIAQNVYKVLPEAVSINKSTVNINGAEQIIEDYHSISYDRITALLVEAIKELKQETDNQQEQIEILKKQNNILLERVEFLENQ